jgi:DNA-binding NtrC family response regulator
VIPRRLDAKLRQPVIRVLFRLGGASTSMLKIEDAASKPSPSPQGGRAESPEIVMVIEGAPLPSLHEVEQRYIARVLKEAHGNQRQAALILGISRWSLARRVRKYGLQPRTAA